VQKFVTENHFTFTVPLDTKGDFGSAYKADAIPMTVIVGRDGIVKKVFVGYDPGLADDIKTTLEAALAAPKP
jgi:hypothetical protein